LGYCDSVGRLGNPDPDGHGPWCREFLPYYFRQGANQTMKPEWSQDILIVAIAILLILIGLI